MTLKIVAKIKKKRKDNKKEPEPKINWRNLRTNEQEYERYWDTVTELTAKLGDNPYFSDFNNCIIAAAQMNLLDIQETPIQRIF
mmetsp:Transcript_27033/g.32775  ORF Transcript_27033/g.32775 Transcript_27033/m.32775 type:complete len:84 (-) Transcript_27033:163-414(-)